MSASASTGYAIAGAEDGETHFAIYSGSGMSVCFRLTDDNALEFAERIRQAVLAKAPRVVTAADLGLEAA